MKKLSPIQENFLAYSFKMTLLGKIITQVEIFLITLCLCGLFMGFLILILGVPIPIPIAIIIQFVTCIIMSLANMFNFGKTATYPQSCSWFLYKYFPISKDSRERALEKLIRYGYDEQEIKQGLDLF